MMWADAENSYKGLAKPPTPAHDSFWESGGTVPGVAMPKHSNNSNKNRMREQNKFHQHAQAPYADGENDDAMWGAAEQYEGNNFHDDDHAFLLMDEDPHHWQEFAVMQRAAQDPRTQFTMGVSPALSGVRSGATSAFGWQNEKEVMRDPAILEELSK